MDRQEGRQTQFDHQARLLSATQQGWIKGEGDWGEGAERYEVSAGISEVISSALVDFF